MTQLKNIKNRIRSNFKNVKLKRYLLYALGEILLIVAGVLIAVNINNFNDAKKQEENLNLILGNITDDLNSDIKNLDQLITAYEDLDSIITNIVDDKYKTSYFDTINQTNFLECTPCFAYHIGFFTFSPKLDGYNQLQDFNLSPDMSDKKLSHDILLFYKENLKDNKIIEESLVNTVLKNIESMEQFDWYSDYMLNRYNAKSIEYFQNHQMYKNKLVSFKTLALENHLSLLRNYKASAKILLQSIKDYS